MPRSVPWICVCKMEVWWYVWCVCVHAVVIYRHLKMCAWGE